MSESQESPAAFQRRIQERIRAWGVRLERSLETSSSFLAFGERDGRPVVLKVIRRPGDEWKSGDVLAALSGPVMVRVYERFEGAVLMERLVPGNSLCDLVREGRDEEAAEILARVVERMPVVPPGAGALPEGVSTAQDWGRGFDRHIDTGSDVIPEQLIQAGRRTYRDLCATQRSPRLLHGDLQHSNLLFDGECGWVAIDPKGVMGEVEFEFGAALRNPDEIPSLFESPRIVERRIARFSRCLSLDPDRVLSWAFGQAVLSAIWTLEDGLPLRESDPSLRLARTIQRMM